MERADMTTDEIKKSGEKKGGSTSKITGFFSKVDRSNSGRTETQDGHRTPSSTPLLSGPELTKVETCKQSESVPSTMSQQSTAIFQPFQPRNFKFPKTKFGSQFRAFQPSWFDEFPWLHYLDGEDRVVCFFCVVQDKNENLQSCRNKEETFISIGYNNWKKAVTKFRDHQESKSHKTALTYQLLVPKCANALAMMDKQAELTMQTNRQCFLKIMQTLRFLGRQGIALQGDNDEESNFYQLLKLRSIDDKRLGEWLENKRDKYTSHDIQNEILGIMSHSILRGLASEIRSNFFSLICDDYTDIANKEQLTLCIRWIDNNLEAHEDFLGFYNVPNICSDTLVSVIKDALVRLQLSLDSCRGQCYDGASNMLGYKSGVAKKICDIQRKAHATHCHAHSLSLCVKDTTEKCKILSDAMDIGREIVALVKYSPKRENMLGNIKENVEEGLPLCDKTAPGLAKLSTTRWTVRAVCFQRILENYQSLMDLWRECINGQMDSDTKARIIGCEHQMTKFDFYFGLNLGQKIFCHTDNLSKTLQATKMSAVSSRRIAKLTKMTLQNLRNDQCFEQFYTSVLLKAKQHEFIGEPLLSRKRRCPVRYEEGTGQPCFQHNAKDEHRRIYFEAIDLIVESLEFRFNQPSFKAYERLESLILNALKSEDIEDDLEFLKTNYSGDVDIPALHSQLCLLPTIFRSSLDVIVCFQDFLSELKRLPSEERQLISHVVTVSKLLHVNPATSASGERSFSTARRLKTWLRSKMTQQRFNSIAIIHSHKQRADTLSLVDIGNLFVSNENRRRNFGKFINEDVRQSCES